MSERSGASWVIYALGVLCVGAIVTAVLIVGPASGSQSSVTRTATVADGVVQSTVSGSGNLAPVSQLDLGFKTSGTVTRIDVTQGEHVSDGQLLAELDPESAEVTLEAAKATLQSAEANLAREEETDGESSAGSSGSGAGATATAAAVAPTSTVPSSSSEGTGASTVTTPAAAPTTTTESATTPSHESTKPSAESKGSAGQSSDSGSTDSGTSTAKTTVSAATREANIASARAQVRSDTLTVQGAEQALTDTKLYAPESGTIVSLSGQVGEVVSGGGTTKVSPTAASSSSSTGTSAASGGSGTRGASAATGSSTDSSSSTGTSSPFAVLSDLSSMELVVPLSESEIGNVRVGQIATVTVEALSGRKLAARVGEVATLSSSNSGVVSYDVTFALEQTAAGLKPGMSATAEVVVKQAEGVNVPTTAISAGTVTVVRDGRHVRQRVVTGLAGNSSTIVLSGLKAGETVVLPSLSTTSSTGSRSALGRAGLGGLGGAGGLGGGGGGIFLRGGG